MHHIYIIMKYRWIRQLSVDMCTVYCLYNLSLSFLGKIKLQLRLDIKIQIILIPLMLEA